MREGLVGYFLGSSVWYLWVNSKGVDGRVGFWIGGEGFVCKGLRESCLSNLMVMGPVGRVIIGWVCWRKLWGIQMIQVILLNFFTELGWKERKSTFIAVV